MTELSTYAQLAAEVYGVADLADPANPTVRSAANTVPLPDGWTRFRQVDAGDSPATDNGFLAAAYRNGNEVVVTYGGTTWENLLDWSEGNIPSGIGSTLSPQLKDAAKFYLDTIAALPALTDGEYSVRFAGHSLGGGLASVMSVFFDRPATVFDPAFFERSADSAVVVDALRSFLTAAGYALPNALAEYQATGDPTSDSMVPSPTRVAREGNVDIHYVRGEVLSELTAERLDVTGRALDWLWTTHGLSLDAPVAYLLRWWISGHLDEMASKVDGLVLLHDSDGNITGATLGSTTLQTSDFISATRGLDKINWDQANAYGPELVEFLLADPMITSLAASVKEVGLKVFSNLTDLHSMSLMVAYLASPTFANAARQLAALPFQIFSAGIGAQSATSTEVTLIDSLVQRQLKGGGALDVLGARRT